MHTPSPVHKSSLLRAGQTVGSVVDSPSLALAGSPAVAALCDLVEFRVDALAAEVEAVAAAMRSCPLPVLLTVRDPAEGGIGNLDSAAREQLFLRLLPHAGLVDLETANLPRGRAVLEGAHRLGIPVIASFHDFSGTPAPSELTVRVQAAQAAGADAVKFATTLRGAADLHTLAALQESAPLPVATMGMGPLGRVSRLLLASLGSVLNYGYLDRPTVPGQWPARRLRDLIAELRPGDGG